MLAFSDSKVPRCWGRHRGHPKIEGVTGSIEETPALHADIRTTRGVDRLVVEECLTSLQAKGIGNHRGGSASNGMWSPHAWLEQAAIGTT